MNAQERTRRTRVWIVEDNAAYLRGLARSIQQSAIAEVTGTSTSVEDAVEQIVASGGTADVILLDVGLPGVDGIEGIADLHGCLPRARILLLTVFEDEEKIFRAVCAGVSGYLLKTALPEEIIAAIREVDEGGAPMHPKVASRVLALLREGDARSPGPPVQPLLEKERRVLQLMADGLSKKQIAHEMAISIHTVTFHLRNIYEKLHLNTNTGAIAKALRHRLI